MLQAISPIDGRYASKTQELSPFFSEFGLIKYRVLIEVQYFLQLVELGLPQLEGISPDQLDQLERLTNQFSLEDAARIKEIERTTNHDVKAVEYFLKEAFDRIGLGAYKEFIHFGLTSQDINNTSVPLMLKHALEHVYYPFLQEVIEKLDEMAGIWASVPMLARTHGQPATPTSLGREIEVFSVRVKNQLKQLKVVPHAAKFGGATGNLNAHHVAFPHIDWHQFATHFVEETLGLHRSFPTTQIEHYDNLASACMALSRINTILVDFARDIWTYISMEYFNQKVVAGEVGSSAMPHKVNPIDFENAEGNFGIANAIFGHLAAKLPISRLQRDLTDSTVIRNLGVPIGHTLIGFKSLLKGMSKINLNQSKLAADLEANWMVVAEAIQNVLRREGFDQPYEALKGLTRGNAKIGEKEIHQFIDSLKVPAKIKSELKAIRPDNYLGR